MEQIAGVIQENSATAEESAAASEELSAQALLLKGLLERFRLTIRMYSDRILSITLMICS